jgi:C1A family cysteine protease
MPRKLQRYGWIPDQPDHRDYVYSAPRGALRSLPPGVDLRPGCPPVFDQGLLGSCTANAIAAAIQFDQIKQRQVPVFTASRLFIYYNGRLLAGTVDSDAGLMLRDGVKSVTQLGACPEHMWPYQPAALYARPPGAAYQMASWHRAVRYQRLAQTLSQMKGCLASGYPFVFGFSVYESFESEQIARTGIASLPGPRETVIGGHAALAVGYDDARQWFIVRNSWGPGWGMGGYFTLPYTYMTQDGLVGDLWTVQLVR